MFRAEMERKLKNIFGFSKNTFNAPGEAYEQDTLFIEVGDAKSRAGQGDVSSKVSGFLTVYSQNNKLQFGFFQKKIQQAKLEDTKNFFFYNFDEDVASSPARIQNINERRVRFIYLYDAQYDPDQGELTGTTFEGSFQI